MAVLLQLRITSYNVCYTKLLRSYPAVGGCGTVANLSAYPTYAVSTDITSADNVDVYDGAEYNTYTSSAKLTAYPYFTDTMKKMTGTSRPSYNFV